MINCVISDLGKVILFFDNDIFFRKMAGFCPFSADEIALRIRRHKDIIRSFDTGKTEPEDFYREVVLMLDAKIGQETFFRFYNDVFTANAPVLDLLKKLKPSNTMILLSNTDVKRFGFVKKKFPAVFLFDHYVLSYEVGFMKPNPKIYKEALKKAGVPAEECVFLDDMPENIQEAQRLGMSAVLYVPQTDLEGRLKKLNMTF
jgi:HAD superfamily hydrolase (TIGR01509 family)